MALIKSRRSLISVAVASALLTACSGGGDNNNTGTTPSPTPAVTPTPTVTPTPIVTPTPTARKVQLAPLSGNIRMADKNANENAGIAISVRAFDASGNQLTAAPLTGTTQSSGAFSMNLPDVETGAAETIARLEVKATKTGYADANSVYTDVEANQVIVVNKTLNPVAVQAPVATSSAVANTANGEPVIRLALIKTSAGQAAIIAGEAVTAVEADKQIEVEIPADRINDQVTHIKPAMAQFDPNDPTQVSAFPGLFEGFGETEDQGQGVNLDQRATAAAEPAGYQLVSSTFAQIRLLDQDDQPLGLQDAAQAASNHNPVMRFLVPKESYKTITKDQSLDDDGIQVPIYIYSDQGKWEFVGNGLLVLPGNDLFVPTTPPDGEGKLDISDETVTIFVEIEIVDGNEWIQWINLDWPRLLGGNFLEVRFTSLVEYEKTDPDPNVAPETYSGEVQIEAPDGSQTNIYVQNGELNISPDSNALLLPQELTGELLVYAFNKLFERQLIATINISNVTGSGSVEIDSAPLLDPNRCKAAGKLTDGATNQGIGDQWVFVRSTDWQFTGYSFTEKADNTELGTVIGDFALNVPCDKPLIAESDVTPPSPTTTASLGNPANFNLVTANKDPEIDVSAAEDEVEAGQNLMIYVQAWDPDSDTAPTVSACYFAPGESLPASPGADVCDTATDAVSTLTPSGENYELSTSAQGAYTIYAVATDAAGAQAVSEPLTIDALPEGNKPPEIEVIQVSTNGSNKNVAPGDEITIKAGTDTTLTAVTFDANAEDVLTPLWTITPKSEGAALSCTDANSNTCALTIPAEGDYEVSFKVTDQPASGEALTDEQSFTLHYLPDQPPHIDNLWLSFASFLVGDAARFINVAVSDDDTPVSELSFSWTLTGPAGPVTLPVSDTQKLDLSTVTLAAGAYSATLTVTETGLDPVTSEPITFDIQANQAPEVGNINVTQNNVTPTMLWAGPNGLLQDVTLLVSVKDDNVKTSDLLLAWSLTPDVSEARQNRNQLTLPKGSFSGLTSEQTLDVSFTATEPGEGGQSTEQTTSLLVKPDLPPVITDLKADPASQNAAPDGLNAQTVTVKAIVSDDNTAASEFGYDWTVTPSTSFSGGGNLISFDPDVLAVGSYTVDLTITDKSGQTAIQQTSFEVLEPDPNQTDEPPVIKHISVSPQTQQASKDNLNRFAITLTADVSDDFTTTENLTFEWSGASGFTTSDGGQTITFAGATLATGEYNMLLKITDEAGNSAQQTVPFAITQHNGNVDIIVN